MSDMGSAQSSRLRAIGPFSETNIDRVSIYWRETCRPSVAPKSRLDGAGESARLQEKFLFMLRIVSNRNGPNFQAKTCNRAPKISIRFF
jgi:hypothetical protein